MVKNLPADAGDKGSMGSVPGLEIFSGGRNGGSSGKNLPAMQEMRVLSLAWEDPLEEGMATHSSIFAWRIPLTEEPGGLQTMGLQSRT